jgi:hypothetical protein
MKTKPARKVLLALSFLSSVGLVTFSLTKTASAHPPPACTVNGIDGTCVSTADACGCALNDGSLGIDPGCGC